MPSKARALRGRLAVLLRSAGVGALATVVDLLALAALVSGLGLDPRVANVPGLALGVATQFVGNKLFAFRDRSGDWARQGAWFAAVEVGALALNALIFDRLVAGAVPYLVARLVATSVVYFGFSLPLWSKIFRPAEGG